jgi:hypothetical protein
MLLRSIWVIDHARMHLPRPTYPRPPNVVVTFHTYIPITHICCQRSPWRIHVAGWMGGKAGSRYSQIVREFPTFT